MALKKTNSDRQFKSAFAEVFKATSLIETSSNYSVADSTAAAAEKTKTSNEIVVTSEQAFWKNVLRPGSSRQYEQRITIPNCRITKWVPRVPGLYWADQSKILRNFGSAMIEAVDEKWNHLTPQGKSMDVMGGIGTNMFAPDENGNRLAGLMLRNDASTAIPALITGDVWDELKLKDGSYISVIKARWQLMAQQWLSRFIGDAISRAYLVINKPGQISVINNFNNPYTVHPYSIMEYTSDGATFYDYVFYRTEMQHNTYDRHDASDFFETYRKNRNRNGHYLLASDIEDPLFDAVYSSPEDIRRNEVAGKTHLQILKEKIKQRYYHGKLIDEVIIDIGKLYNDQDDITRLAAITGIAVNQLAGNRTSDLIAALVYQCVEADKVELLINRIAQEHPYIIK
jgi:hypothetical protein